MRTDLEFSGLHHKKTVKRGYSTIFTNKKINQDFKYLKYSWWPVPNWYTPNSLPASNPGRGSSGNWRAISRRT